jgi:hypothetical protein
VVLVSSRVNDLSDAARFPMLSSDPARQAIARRMRTVNTATEELGEYFQAE